MENREIKFRAWSYNRMYLWPELSKNYNMTHWLNDLNRGDETLKLMQYTGLKDKNDVEIYAGDLLQDEENMLWEVKYNIELAAYVVENMDIPGIRYLCNSLDMDHVGNIYDNPELLEENQL